MARAAAVLEESAALAKTSLPPVAHAPKRVCDGRVLTPVKDGVLEDRTAQGDGLRGSPETWELVACLRESRLTPEPLSAGTLRPRNIPRLRLRGMSGRQAREDARCLAHPAPAAGSAHTGLYGFGDEFRPLADTGYDPLPLHGIRGRLGGFGQRRQGGEAEDARRRTCAARTDVF
jgi:hypothetical protein